MSAHHSNITAQTILKSFPAPPQTCQIRPHIHNVFAKPRKYQQNYHLKFSCHETKSRPYWGCLMDKFVYDKDIADYYMLNHQHLGRPFSKFWKEQTNCIIPSPNDAVYDAEDRCLFLIDTVNNDAGTPYIHPVHRERFISITANKICIKDTLDSANVTVSTKEYYLDVNHIKIIGSLTSDKIKEKISKMELFAIGDSRFHRILCKKLISIPKPTKRARKVSASDDFDSKHWSNYLQDHLSSNNTYFNVNRSVAKFKFRTAAFEACFPFVCILTEDAHRIAYLDYFQFKISLRTDRTSLNCVFLKKDKITGLIEGEDLIPDDF